MSTPLVEMFQQRMAGLTSQLSESFQQLQVAVAAKIEDPTVDLQTVIVTHDHHVKLLARTFVMLDKARRITKEQRELTADQVAFLVSLIEFHSGYTRVWDNETKYDTFLLELLNVLNQTIKYYDYESGQHDYSDILEGLLTLWRTAKKLYPKESAFIQVEFYQCKI
uniref:Uncharacterized protein n=1 Tax=viral metagenome TaxID=1070528 RepID=A0A6C0I2H6_9ZZZZ